MRRTTPLMIWRVRRSGICSQNVETLLVWNKECYLHWFKVDGTEIELDKFCELEFTYSIKAKILEAQSEASKDVNTPVEMFKGLDK
ncbi:hypothetical protein Tco_0191376 [Tanacetum coccineum]